MLPKTILGMCDVGGIVKTCGSVFCYLTEKLLIRRYERRSLGPELLAEDRAGREMGPEGEATTYEIREPLDTGRFTARTDLADALVHLAAEQTDGSLHGRGVHHVRVPTPARCSAARSVRALEMKTRKVLDLHLHGFTVPDGRDRRRPRHQGSRSLVGLGRSVQGSQQFSPREPSRGASAASSSLLRTKSWSAFPSCIARA